jgi:hypothetical protein
MKTATMMTLKAKTMSSNGRTNRKTRGVTRAIAALFAVSLLALSAGANATLGADPAPDEVNAKCLKCHSKGLKKALGDGEKLSLQVAQIELANSAHKDISCTSCHTAIAGQKHPAKASIETRRAFALEQNENCRVCHASKFVQYEGSVHARLVAEGNLAAPVCTDCHSAHAVQSMSVYQPETGLPCKKCHESIYDAYAQSVHGKARTEGNVIRPNHIQAPICADCHQAHEVKAVAAGEQLRATCLNCHDDARLAHDQWLPNSELHLSVVSCPACHSPLAQRRIDLELYDKVAKVPVGQTDDGASGRMSEIEKSEGGLDAVQLWQLVRQSSRDGQAVDVTLRGRMKVQTGAEAHQLAVKASAVRDCESCHRKGSTAFENVTVSIASPDGRKTYYPADGEVLSSVVSVDSLGDFYAMGGTRIRLLDGLLILALIGGLAVPVGHVTIGRLLKKKRQ